jgi:DNA-binding response OmpR family regulator
MNERKILVVDDEEIIRDILEQAFSQSGYTVRSAENAERALEILRGEKIQVMFLDLNMPGMNGLDLCRRIREEYPISVIHALTGHGSLFQLSDSRQAGFDDYFAKPVDLGVLYKAAEDAFEKIEMWNLSEEK